MKAILALVLALALSGVASAWTVDAPDLVELFSADDLIQMEELAGWNLIFGTPAFSAAWGEAQGESEISEDVAFGTLGEECPDCISKVIYPTSDAQLLAEDPMEATNFVVDPSASLNFSGSAAAGIAEVITYINDTTGDPAIKALTLDLATAKGLAQTDVTAEDNAWTAAVMDVTAEVEIPDEDGYLTAESDVDLSVAAIADHASLGF